MLSDFDLFPSTEKETRVILNDLHQQGCCPRCILRFLGEKKPSSYTLSEQELYSQIIKPNVTETEEDTAGKEEEQTTYSAQKCPACLGILQEFACQDFYQQVLEKVKEEGHEFSDYQISLMLPVATILRQHAVFVYLVQKYQSTYEEKEDKVCSIKDAYKWSSGLSFSKLLGVPFQMRSSFDILLNLTYKPSDQECHFLLDTFPDTFRRRKVKKRVCQGGLRDVHPSQRAEGVGRNDAIQFLQEVYLSTVGTQSGLLLRHLCILRRCVCGSSYCLAGRYQKYSRVLSQTPWIIDGVTKMEGSVQELVCQVILSNFKPTDHKFSASGREDVDVQMLGMGRPFVVELINPHKIRFSPEDLKAIQKETNARTVDVGIRDLQIVTRDDVGKLKEGEEDKSKSYTALCWCERPLSPDDIQKLEDTKDLVLYQKTPIRVLHRRTLATRERTIYCMKVEPTSGLQFKLHLSTQAGTYVKEFVHGDFGRTQPNLRTLLSADCDILALDVTAVNIDWPARIDPVPAEEEKVENGDPQERTKAGPYQPLNHPDGEVPQVPT